MGPNTIYRKTMIFNWIRLGLGLLTALLAAIIFLLCWLAVTKLNLALYEKIFLSCLGFLLAVGIHYFAMARFGYSLKLGQLAVVARAYRGEGIPPNPVEYARDVLRRRFGNVPNFYLMARKMRLTLAQFANIRRRGFDLNSEHPQQEGKSRKLAKFLSLPALSYADECCLSYVLDKPSQELNASCVDALSLFVQNWPRLLKRALRISLLANGTLLLLALLFYIPGYLWADRVFLNTLPWLGISILLALAFKLAFVDSWVLIRMLTQYLRLAVEYPIDPNNYEKLDHWSPIYATLRKDARFHAQVEAQNKADKQDKS